MERYKELSEQLTKASQLIEECQKIIADAQKGPFIRLAFGEVPIKEPFGKLTWSEIKQRIVRGEARELWNIGEFKTIKLSTGELVSMRIIGFDQEPYATGHTVTFESIFTLDGFVPMVNKGEASGGWEASSLRRWLNGPFFDLLPKDLREVIRPTMKDSYTDGLAAHRDTTLDNIFVLSESEIFGRGIYSNGDEGPWYEWYRQPGISYTRRDSAGNLTCAWTRSLEANSDEYACVIRPGGAPGSLQATSRIRTTFAFCL